MRLAARKRKSKEKKPKLNLHHFQLSRKIHLTALLSMKKLIEFFIFFSFFSYFFSRSHLSNGRLERWREGWRSAGGGGTSSAALRKQSFRREISLVSTGGSIEDPIKRWRRWKKLKTQQNDGVDFEER